MSGFFNWVVYQLLELRREDERNRNEITEHNKMHNKLETNGIQIKCVTQLLRNVRNFAGSVERNANLNLFLSVVTKAVKWSSGPQMLTIKNVYN